MNKRIRELAAQADADVGENVSFEFCEKFAELIVRECAKVVDLWSDEVPCSEGYDKLTVSKLKEHFGVDK